MGGDTSSSGAISPAALLRRWNLLRDRCTNELYCSDGVDPASLQRLRQKLDELEKEVAGYRKEQDTNNDPFWLGSAVLDMLNDISETVRNLRAQVDVIAAYQEHESADTTAVASTLELSEEDGFLLAYDISNEEKAEPTNPSSRFHSMRTLRETLQGNVMFGIDCETGEHVVLKLSSKAAVFRQESMAGDKIMEDPINEVRLLEQLRTPGHRHVVRLIDSLEDEENYWSASFSFFRYGQVDECVCSISGWFWNLHPVVNYSISSTSLGS